PASRSTRGVDAARPRGGPRRPCNARPLGIVRFDQAFHDVSGRSEKNEVFEAVVVVVGLGLHATGGLADREIDPVTSLPFEIRIADFERRVPPVRTVVVQLFQRWSAV